jgi:predicted nucleotidyltransferase
MTEAQRKIEAHREEIRRIAEIHGARNVRLFGSVARGEDDASSDVDLLVDLDPGRGLLDLGGLLMDLRDLLQARVDVATPALLKARIRDRILREAVAL